MSDPANAGKPGLPPRPEGFEPRAYDVYDSEPFFPKRCPPSARFVAGVEWSFDIGGAENDLFYISSDRHRRYWFLWADASVEDAEPEFQCSGVTVDACALRGDVPRRVAAIYLLMAAWQKRYGGGERPWFMVTHEGLLAVDDIEAIAQVIWPGSKPSAWMQARLEG